MVRKRKSKSTPSADLSARTPDESSSSSTSIVAFTHARMSGPLPPPQLLADYEQALPGAADRIIQMAEQEQRHRHQIESEVVAAQIVDAKAGRVEARLGQIFALAIGLFALGCGTYAATHGAQWSGAILGGGGVAALVTAFIIGRTLPNKRDKIDPRRQTSDSINDRPKAKTPARQDK